MPASANASIAVLYSGWLSVHVPEQGLDARHNLVDILGADVFVAGTYLPSERQECQRQRAARGNLESAIYRCLFRRLKGLRPFARARADPMLTTSELHRRVARSPHWKLVSGRFDPRATMDGVNVFAPVLGNGNLSVLRELHDYHRALRLVEAHEAQRRGARRYARLVFSRLEFEWLAPHPPIELFEPASAVWLPSGGVSGGLNDRHALLSRAAADVYMRRWQLLLSPQLLHHVPLRVVLAGGPEDFLREVLASAKLLVRYFPSTFALGCCSASALAAGRCFGSTVCIRAIGVRTPAGTRPLDS